MAGLSTIFTRSVIPALLVSPMHGVVIAEPLQVAEEAASAGQVLWQDNCEGCHAYGIADAPVPSEPEQWKFRIEKGMDTLYDHAINGFIGPDYSVMPERGGNPELSDEQVRSAVDHMVELAEQYIDSTESK